MHIDGIRVILTMINFVVLYFILRHFFFKPVNNVISSREDEIINKINKTEENEKKAMVLLKEKEEDLKKAKVDGKAIVENYKVKAEKVSEELIKEANDEAKLIMERARKEIEREKEKAQSEIKTQIIDLAVLMSQKALDESINEEQHRRLINDFISKVGI